MLGGGPEPTDKAMYNRIKARVKKEWQKKSRWPSAYGSAHLVENIKRLLRIRMEIKTLIRVVVL